MYKQIRYVGYVILIIGIVTDLILPLFIPILNFGGIGGIITIVTGIALIAWTYYSENSNKKFIKESLPTLGTILSMKQTGLYVNNQPQIKFIIEILLPDGNVAQGSIKHTIRMIEMANFSEGKKVPIRYHKNDPTKMIFDLNPNIEELQKAQNQILIKKGLLDPALLEISKTGIPGKGIIMESHPTGKLLDKLVEMVLKLTITGDNGETFEVETKRGINNQMMKYLQVGSIVKVIYLQSNHSKFVIQTPAQ